MSDQDQRVDKTPLTEQLHAGSTSAYARYKAKASGEVGTVKFLLYELFNLLLSNLGGAVGYVLRKAVARHLFGEVGGGLILGRGLTVRHPGNIYFGNNVAIDDNVLLDAGGAGEQGVKFGDGVIVSRNCVVQGKTGPVHFEDRVDVGCNCVFSSVAGITVGSATIIAGCCYLGGGRYFHGNFETPIMDQGGYSRGPLTIGKNSWIGAGATILDGVTVGKGVIVGAGSVVTKDIPDYAIVAGTPATVLRMRNSEERQVD
jgi:acetyltransferase-like isoleucine patch superfamily enzyme